MGREGCYVVYDKRDCSSLNCPKKIIHENLEVDGIRYEGVPSMEYFPSSFGTKKVSVVKMLKNIYKFKSPKIRNISEIKFHLNSNKKSIIHGIGCLEDIFPNQFKKMTFNQCGPIPFLIDGLIQDKKGNHLILRTALDEIHSPRIVSWNYVFNAIKNYSLIHPRKTWTLYGLK